MVHVPSPSLERAADTNINRPVSDINYPQIAQGDFLVLKAIFWFLKAFFGPEGIFLVPEGNFLVLKAIFWFLKAIFWFLKAIFRFRCFFLFTPVQSYPIVIRHFNVKFNFKTFLNSVRFLL